MNYPDMFVDILELFVERQDQHSVAANLRILVYLDAARERRDAKATHAARNRAYRARLKAAGKKEPRATPTEYTRALARARNRAYRARQRNST